MYSLLILNFIIPFVMSLLGYLLKKYPVTDRNSGCGYNTPASRSSQEHWDYAQEIAPQVDVILFAQGSMAYAEEYIAEKTGKVVLSSPRFGAIALRCALEAKGLIPQK